MDMTSSLVGSTELLSVTERPERRALLAHHEAIRRRTLRTPSGEDAKRTECMTVEGAGMPAPRGGSFVVDGTDVRTVGALARQSTAMCSLSTRHLRLAGVLALVLGALGAGVPAEAQEALQPANARPAAMPPVMATRLHRPGLPRLGMVTSRLYRGGQPEDRGYAELKALGVDLVVNLRDESDEIARERALVEPLGFRYASIPWRGKDDPRPEQMEEFLTLVRANPGSTIFVHCKRGAERTGVMIAWYRMSVDHWTPEQALDEMDVFGFRRFGFGHLRRFVRAYPVLTMAGGGQPEAGRTPARAKP